MYFITTWKIESCIFCSFGFVATYALKSFFVTFSSRLENSISPPLPSFLPLLCQQRRFKEAFLTDQERLHPTWIYIPSQDQTMGSSKKSSKNKDTHRDDDDVAEPSPPRTADIFRTNDDDLETQEANVQDVQNELPASNNDQAVKKRLMIKRAVVTVLLFLCLAGIATVVILLATSAPFKNKVDENAAVSPGETTQPNTPPITPPTSVGDGGSRPTTPQGGGGAANTPTSPPKMATSAPTAGSLARIVSYLQGETGINFNEDGSEALAYKQAVTWLAQDTDEPVYDAKLIQRFAVLAVDFALKGSSQSDGAIDEIEPTIGVHDIDECTWQGIVCNGTTVVELHLPRLNLSGTIPPSISLLSDITHIDLNTNDIHGTIPESLYDLTGLNSLYLYKNQLQGFVSTSIRKLTNLENLWLNENAMTGPFPVGISSTDSFIHPIRKWCGQLGGLGSFIVFSHVTLCSLNPRTSQLIQESVCRDNPE